MRENYKVLFEFVSSFSDIQIKKYVNLALIGVGPDARMNAHLVFKEVEELLGFANQLLDLIEQPEHDLKNQAQSFSFIFNQVKFYLEQDHLRAYAGWLLDDNHIHNPLIDLLNKLLPELEEIGRSALIDINSVKPVTAVQQQCEHDSHLIAFYILDLAKKLVSNPNMELDETIPKHARGLLKRNIITRYSQEEFAKPIDELHKKCEDFLKGSTLEKTNTQLLKEDAHVLENEHRGTLNQLLARYKRLEPSSKLFVSEHEWHKMSASSKDEVKLKSEVSNNNRLFFGKMAGFGCILVGMFISYFTYVSNQDSLTLPAPK